MSPIKGKRSQVPGAFTPTVRIVERTAVAKLMHWMCEIIEEENLNLGCPEVDTSGDDRKSPDMVVFESPHRQRVLCVIEAKPPNFDVYNEVELKEPARQKAVRRQAPYFAVTNFRDLVWYDTEKVNANRPEPEQICNYYPLSKIEDLNKIEHVRYKDPIQKGLESFLLKLFKVHTRREPLPRLAIDELLIHQIHSKIGRLAYHYARIIEDKAHKDRKFAAELRRWFADQDWSFQWQEGDFEKAARQTAYLLTNKILFYMTLQIKRPQDLDPLDIPASLTKGELLAASLQAYFKQVLKIDYEEIYTADFIDSIAFPDSEEVVEEIKELVKILRRYDLGKLGFDVIGRIFEKLIPMDERHILGQYFTHADAVDIILRFCHNHEDDVIMDPSCGAGTFLVRAYQHKKLLNPRKGHDEILPKLWGTDIAKFPTHLAIINLAIRDLVTADKNYPNIVHEDFFKLQVGKDGCDLELWRKKHAKTLGVNVREITYPRYFDAIVGNPPYTRQEELTKISREYGKKKEKLITNCLYDISGRKLTNLAKRAGIHAYFFIHGWKFLKEAGYFGFVVSNSWLDVGYGAGLQEFFLKNYKIICIIESKVERWFADADVNTCIVILQKCKNEKNRNENLCRFVYLKKRLAELIPKADEDWDKQKARLDALSDLKKLILAHSEFYENDDLRIFPVKQADLWKEGYDDEEKQFVGAKWGKYLRAPKIFFTILEKGKGKLAPLKDVAKVRRGFTTGANQFFYLTEWEATRKRLEAKFLQPIIFSLKEIDTYRVDRSKLKKRAIICWLDRNKLYKTRLLDYIKLGEKKKYRQRPTCKSREPWYVLGKDWDYAPLIFPAKVGERMPVFLNDNVYEDKKLYGIIPKKNENILLLAGLLNSTLTRFFIDLTCRQLTGAQAIADIDVVVVENLAIPSPSNIPKKIGNRIGAAFEKLSHTKSESIFREIARSSAEVSLESVKENRRALDQIVMGDILGLTEEEQLEVYRAVVDLVRSRLDKAKSVAGADNGDQGELEGVCDDLLGALKNVDEGGPS